MTVTEVAANGDRRAAAEAEYLACGGNMTIAEFAEASGLKVRQAGTVTRELKVRLAANGGGPASGVSPPRLPAPRAIDGNVVAGARVGAARKGSLTGARRRSRTSAHRGKLPWPLVGLTVVAGLMVLTVTAVVSYTHVRHLAEIAGQADLAAWYPLGVDGLVAVCSGVLLWDRHAGRPVSWVARIGAGLGLVATFVANGMAYDPDLASVYVAGLILAVYPPVALAVVWHLLNRMLVER